MRGQFADVVNKKHFAETPKNHYLCTLIMESDKINLGEQSVSRLFRLYFVPTLLGMLSLCIVTMADGIFVGQGVGPVGVAAVNIVFAPLMMLIGMGLMVGIGCSVMASIRLAHGEEQKARLGVSRALAGATAICVAIVLLMLIRPAATVKILGASGQLVAPAIDYLVWLTPSMIANMWSLIGLFVVRLDGSPRYAMWCNVVPGLLNILLDWVFIFPLGMGLKGAGIATSISITVGGLMAIFYLWGRAERLRLISLPFSCDELAELWLTLRYQMRIGVSAFLGEATMGMVMLTGNIVFMHWLGADGVAAFGIACYYCPFFFMIGNAIAQSAQPIISYNYGLDLLDRVKATERIAIQTALAFGVTVTAAFILFPRIMVELFIAADSQAAILAIEGLPLFAACIVFFIFNVTVIGYFQSVERVWPSVWFALMRGVLFLIPSFVLLPHLLGTSGIWLALTLSELLTTAAILTFYIARK